MIQCRVKIASGSFGSVLGGAASALRALRAWEKARISSTIVDLANDQLPTFSYLVPNLLDDAHDGPLQVADAWLEHCAADRQPDISEGWFIDHCLR